MGRSILRKIYRGGKDATPKIQSMIPKIKPFKWFNKKVRQVYIQRYWDKKP